MIELLVVIAIIGLLVSLVVITFRDSKIKANNVERLSDIAQYINVFELANTQESEYSDPDDTDWHCLGDYTDDACWQNGNSLSESATLNTNISRFTSQLPANNVLICGYAGSECYEGYIYKCTDRADDRCLDFEVRWFIEGNNESCGIGSEITGVSCDGCTYCRVIP